MRFVRVMDDLKSNAGDFQYKLNEVNIANIWNKEENEPENMGGFNFSSEDKILRWLHRGDTIYDVIIPEDADVVLCDSDKGIYRSNKIIVTNPKTITDEMVLDLYKKTTLSNKIIAECLVTLLWKKRKEISKYIIKDRVNESNIDEILTQFTNYAGKANIYSESGREIYEILKEIKSDILINLYLDKEPYIKNITEDKIINITGESGSGKSFYTTKWLNDDNYIVIDTDILFSDKNTDNKHIKDLRNKIENRFKENSKDALIYNFDECYKIILDYFKDNNKTIVIDSAQYRNIKDISILKGKLIVMRTCIDKCYERCINRYKINNPYYNEDELETYKKRKNKIYIWYKSINELITKINAYKN